MKKFLSVAVAFGFIAGAAATASAWEFSMTGKYTVDGFWYDGYSSMLASTVDGGDALGVHPWDGPGYESTDSDWYQHEFRLDPTLTINDKIRVRMDIRLIDSNTVWSTDTGDGNNDGGNLDINKLWLIYDSPIGKFEIGRRPGGSWGLDFVSSSTNADRIFWHLPTGDGPMKAYVFTEKVAEIDMAPGVDSDGPLVSGFNGADVDYYEAGVGYKTDAVTVWGGLGTKQQDKSINLWRVKAWGQIAAGPGAIVFEGDYKFGDHQGYDSNGMWQDDAVDYNSYAALVAFAGKAGNISYLAGVATISGDNDSDAQEDSAYDPSHGTGDDFEPLYILTGATANVLNGDNGGTNIVRQSGAIAAVATADYAASEDLTLHGGIGWGMADDEPSGWDDAYGWELDAGMAYKLYQNLTYELHFGYWFVGDFAEAGGALETEDVMLLSNHLTMSF